ncbi:MAG: BrnT family toxin [Rhodocyclaceae bacterium]|nr:BrnT family toxin [Rhodocyclaceae bacterium]
MTQAKNNVSALAANLKKHGVSLEEGATVLLDPLALIREDPDAEGERRYLGLGMSDQGRLLVVVWTMRGDTVRPISARKATRKEAKGYA